MVFVNLYPVFRMFIPLCYTFCTHSLCYLKKMSWLNICSSWSINLLIILLIHRLVVLSIKCQEIPEAQVDVLNILFCPQPKDIQFIVIEEERNQKIFTFSKKKAQIL